MDSTDGMIDYAALFLGAPTAFVVLDLDLVMVAANDAFLAAAMRTRQELVGRPILTAFPDDPDDPDANGVAALGASLRRVLRERVTDVMAIQKYGIPEPGGGRFGTHYWAAVNTPVFGPDDELRWILHRTEDVTAYVREQQIGERGGGTDQMASGMFTRHRLHDENQTLNAVVDSLDVAVLGCDAYGRPVLYNDAARTLVGDRLAGLPAAQWPQRLHLHSPDGSPLRAEEHPLVRALSGERVRDAEVVVRAPGEPERIFRVNGRPVTGRPGLAAVVAMHEVTMHRRATRLKECELQVSTVISQPGPADEILHQVILVIGSMIGWAAVEFWTVDDVAQVLRRNTCWAAPGRDLSGQMPDQLLPGQGLPGRAWQSTDPVWAADLRADDVRQPHDWEPLRAAIAVPIPSGATVLGVLVCYSDTAEAPDDIRTGFLTGIAAHIGEFLERRRAERLAAELDRTRDEYIALVGHELRTPLTNIQAYSQMMLDEPDLPADQRAMLTVILRNTTSLHTIVAKLLDVAGMRSGRIDLHARPTDLVRVVRAAVEAARATTAQTTIEVNLPDTVSVDGDPRRLRQAVDEVLSNALTWAADATAVAVNLHADARTTVLTVSNIGARIPEDERNRVFELFFRGDTARHLGVPGTGLGLTLVRAIVEQHSGTVTVSEPDESVTTFTIRLPTHTDRSA